MMQIAAQKKLFSEKEIEPLLRHLHTMMGPHGLYQHATKQTPLLAEGYCTDDNARAVQTLIHLEQHASSKSRTKIEPLIESCWQFVMAAEVQPGTYHNFRSATGEWLPGEQSDDMYARVLRAFAWVLAHAPNEKQQTAAKLLPPLLEHLHTIRAPRGWAEIILAVSEMPAAYRESCANLVATGLSHLRNLWRANGSPDWPWFEPTMTYANALFPHSLLRGLAMVDDPTLREILEKSSQFLLASTVRDGMFIPIGSNGWYPRGGQPSTDNQQPFEAGTMFDFLIDYREQTELNNDIVIAPYLWLFGHNTHRFALVDAEQGICHDGLLTTGPNLNCGAESLLAYLWAEIRLKDAPADLQRYAGEQRQRILAETSTVA